MKWETIPAGQSDIHVIPRDDLRDHDASDSCWCRPTRDADVDEIVIHRSMDGRESYEEGRALQ